MFLWVLWFCGFWVFWKVLGLVCDHVMQGGAREIVFIEGIFNHTFERWALLAAFVGLGLHCGQYISGFVHNVHGSLRCSTYQWGLSYISHIHFGLRGIFPLRTKLDESPSLRGAQGSCSGSNFSRRCCSIPWYMWRMCRRNLHNLHFLPQ